MVNDWEKLIPGAFGCDDLKFALHPCDRERAAEMLLEAIRGQTSFANFCEIIERWLRVEASKKGFKGEFFEKYVAEQMSRVRAVGSYFVED